MHSLLYGCHCTGLIAFLVVWMPLYRAEEHQVCRAFRFSKTVEKLPEDDGEDDSVPYSYNALDVPWVITDILQVPIDRLSIFSACVFLATIDRVHTTHITHYITTPIHTRAHTHTHTHTHTHIHTHAHTHTRARASCHKSPHTARTAHHNAHTRPTRSVVLSSVRAGVCSSVYGWRVPKRADVCAGMPIFGSFFGGGFVDGFFWFAGATRHELISNGETKRPMAQRFWYISIFISFGICPCSCKRPRASFLCAWQRDTHARPALNCTAMRCTPAGMVWCWGSNKARTKHMPRAVMSTVATTMIWYGIVWYGIV